MRVWQTRKFSAPPLTLSGHRSEVWCATFSPDRGTVFAGGKDGDVLSWEINSPMKTRNGIEHTHRNAPFFTPDGKSLIVHRANRSYIHDLTTDRETALRPGIEALGLSPIGNWLLLADKDRRTGRAPIAKPDEIDFYEVALPKERTLYLTCLSGGKWVARTLANGTIHLENPVSGKIVHQLKGPQPGMRRTLAGSADGALIAVGGDGENALVLHDLNHQTVTRLSPVSAYYDVTAAFSADGSLLAAGDLSGPIQIWNLKDRKLIATLPGHPEESSTVVFSPDGKTLASMGYHQDLKFWHVATWRELHSIRLGDAAYSLVFSPNGKQLIATLGLTKNEFIEWFPAEETPAK